VGACTHANPDLYFSYRRDGAGIGQQMSLIGLSG
jgi:copper oxidase (laccase) domain-containing protein